MALVRTSRSPGGQPVAVSAVQHGLDLLAEHQSVRNLVAAGHSNTQIARRLGLSTGTVRKHLENIYGRLQVSSRTAALARAFPDRTALVGGGSSLPSPAHA
jgi:DNA-binding NarL/FixJ family response regulator